MNKNLYEFLKEDMKLLSFIKWDRFITSGNKVYVYGWITRQEDNYKDFVLLIYTKKFMYVEKFYTTSSKVYSKKIFDLIGFSGTHKPCVRVETEFNIGNVIKLKGVK